MISVDPNTVTMVGRVREAVRNLKSEMKGLADQAERYARAMGQKTAGWGAGGRPTNFPEPMSLQQRLRQEHDVGRTPLGGGRGGGGGRFQGGLDPGEERRLITAVLLPQIMQAVGTQLGAVIQRERVTTRLAMAQPGVYTGRGMAQPWQRMLRDTATGYSSTGDLYAGAGALGQAGLLRTAQRGQPGFAETQRLVRETGLAAVMGGTNFQTAAQTVAGFRNPQVVNALRQGLVGGRSITTPFAGGGMQLYGREGLLEQVYQGFGGTRRNEDFYRTSLAAGGAGARTLGAAGFGQEQQELVQQYGIMRAEHPEWSPEKTQKELQKRYRDTGTDLQKFQKSVSDLVDVLTGSLVPVIDSLTTVLKPVAGSFKWIAETIPGFKQALSGLVAALITATVAIKMNSLFGGGGFLGGLRGAAGAGEAGALSRMGASGGALWGRAGTALGSGGVALGGGATLLAAGGMLAGGLGGSWLGRKAGGKGAGGKVGSVLGGAAGGAAVGAGLGLLGGPLAPLTSGVGAIAGGVIGGVAGLFGDAWPDWMREGGIGDAAEAPQGGPASGKDLRGAKSSDANMNPEFAKKLQAMFADNPKLSLTSGWRDPATQARLYKEKPHLAAPPGHSNHEKGLAADIGPASEYAWIASNLGKYGLFLPMPDTNERKVKKKKIEPWHVESAGAVTAGTPVAPVTASTPTAPTKAKAATKAVSPEVRSSTSVQGGAGAYNEATAAAAVFGGAQIGDAWEGGDNTVVFPYTTGGGTQSRSGGGNITIGRIEINLTIARGTPEEAERTARYLGSLLGDRERMLALARGGTP